MYKLYLDVICLTVKLCDCSNGVITELLEILYSKIFFFFNPELPQIF